MTEKPIEQVVYHEGEIIEENISFEEFMARYEGQHVEYYMGKVISRMPNNKQHQLILGFLYLLLSAYLSFTKAGKVFLDGYQMRLADDLPVRQPDLLVVLAANYQKIEKTRLNGAADIVIEIISPATGSNDRGEKFYEYQKGGVPEYWIIDPESKQIDIYSLDLEKHYQRISESKNLIISQVLSKFVFDAKILWQEELPELEEIIELVEEMLETNA